MPTPHEEERRRLLAAYDAQLREGAEMMGATGHDRAGPLWRGKFGARGLVSYRSLGGLTGRALDRLIAQTVEHYAADPAITSAEWKTRGHDLPADLPGRLREHGFGPGEPETVMVGEARHLAPPVTLPEGVRLRRIDNQPHPFPDVVRVAETHRRVFYSPFNANELMQRLESHRGHIELWIAETPDEVVCVGRLEIVPGTDFAGLWGGGTLPGWRGQGIYRALTAARAQSALGRGVRYLHSDSTDASLPILERSGLRPVTTTTPYVWERP